MTKRLSRAFALAVLVGAKGLTAFAGRAPTDDGRSEGRRKA